MNIPDLYERGDLSKEQIRSIRRDLRVEPGLAVSRITVNTSGRAEVPLSNGMTALVDLDGTVEISR